MSDAREQARHNASVMIAFSDGKEIEVSFGHDHWMTCKEPPGWDWRACRYRVKPEERTGWELTVIVKDGLINQAVLLPDGEYVMREVLL